MQNDGNMSDRSGLGPGAEQQQRRGGTGGEFHAEEGTSGVKGMASGATEKLMNTAEQQKRAGADYMSGVADSVRRAAGEFDEQLPQAARYIRRAADQMEEMSDSFRRREMRQMLSDVQSFARRQPAAFLGVSLLAGFAAMRFLKSSSPAASSGRYGGSEDEEVFDDGRYGTPSSSMRAGMPGSRERGDISSGPGM
jgi:hypothetical protein